MKKNRWRSDRLTSLDKRYHTKVRQEYVDYDYIHKLSDSDKLWLADFTKRYVAADFRGPGRVFVRKGPKRKAVYGENNARNRCIYSIKKATKKLYSSVKLRKSQDLKAILDYKVTDASNQENVLIEAIDLTDQSRRPKRKRPQRKDS